MIKNNEKSAEILRAEEQLAQAKARLSEAECNRACWKQPERILEIFTTRDGALNICHFVRFDLCKGTRTIQSVFFFQNCV